MESWILHSIRMSGCQFVTSSSSALGLCSRTMIPNTSKSTSEWLKKNKIKVLEWPNQSLNLNPIEMLWHDLKQSIHARKPSNVAELKQFCKEEWAKIPPQRCERLIASYHKRLIAVVANQLLDLGAITFSHRARQVWTAFLIAIIGNWITIKVKLLNLHIGAW